MGSTVIVSITIGSIIVVIMVSAISIITNNTISKTTCRGAASVLKLAPRGGKQLGFHLSSRVQTTPAHALQSAAA